MKGSINSENVSSQITRNSPACHRTVTTRRFLPTMKLKIGYAFLLILIRITGKRQVGQLAPFDLILLLVLSNAVQNAMNGGDNSVGGGLISAVTLVLLINIASIRSTES